jgi:hypothetical protein
MRWIRALILFSGLIGVAAAQKTMVGPPTALQPSSPIERSLSSYQAHSYTVTADENSSVQVTVEQHGVDVVVTLFSPAGKKLGEYDSPNGDDGPENVSFVVTEKGDYRLEVKPLNQQKDAPSGRYVIKIVEVREATEDELKAGKNLETLKTRAIALLDEIDGIIVELRVPQSRIKAQIQAANLLWGPDEKRAQKYINDAIAGFKELRAEVDTNAKEYLRSYGELSQLRYEIAYMLVNRQPELALTFVRSTPALPDPYNNQREIANQQVALEIEIANAIARTDPKRAIEVARETLKTGFSQNLLNTITSTREQKPELAAELAGYIVDKLLTEKLLKNPEAVGVALGLIRLSGSPKRTQTNEPNSQGRVPLLSEQQQRDLLQKLANEAMNYRPPAGGFTPEREQARAVLSSLQSMGIELDGILTGGAAALEKRASELGSPNDLLNNARYKLQFDMSKLSPDEAMAAIARAPKEFQESLYLELANRLANSGEIAKAKQILNDHVSNIYQRQQALSQIETQDTYQAMSKGKIEDALRNIANLPTVEERASMIAQLINQIGPGQKRAAALNFLEQARALFAPSVRAQGQIQMGALLEIAKAFARYDAKRAFEIVDPLVDQFNELTDAAQVLQGFGADFYDRDELSMSNGNAVGTAATQLSSALGTLALTNFDRTKLMSDRIKLPEVRLRAYLEIAQKALQASN